jgi:hypothetical protein
MGPGGTADNSPPVHWRVPANKNEPRPVGTPEIYGTAETAVCDE